MAVDQKLAVAIILAAWRMPARLLSDTTTICPFRRATGLPCPTCGMTRSWHAAMGGRLRDSVAYHPLGIPALAAVLLVAAGRWRPDGHDAPASGRLVVASGIWLAVWLRRLAAARAPR